MVLFYLTNCALDISMGALWWVTKNTTLGIYNGIYYIKESLEKTDNENNENNDNENNDNDIVIIQNRDQLNEIISLKNEIKKLKMYQKKIN